MPSLLGQRSKGVRVKLEEKGETVIGKGTGTDVIVASAKSYIYALSKMEFKKEKRFGL